jgi:hypothetical protein
MQPLPKSATDEQLVEVVHQWVRLLEAQEYELAFALTEHEDMGWSPSLLRQFVEGYGDAEPNQKVTLRGTPTDITQRIEVSRWPERYGSIGEVWYDLNINGFASDVTATFYIRVVPGGVVLSLNDVHVM